MIKKYCLNGNLILNKKVFISLFSILSISFATAQVLDQVKDGKNKSVSQILVKKKKIKPLHIPYLVVYFLVLQ